ncbi:MAG: hypothetical protein KF816_01145 [Melioribacteraceae bacterium]|jgi:hypothetical protein|nr:hypothetical protein [Melioribacteraceae bacterium]
MDTKKYQFELLNNDLPNMCSATEEEPGCSKLDKCDYVDFCTSCATEDLCGLDYTG